MFIREVDYVWPLAVKVSFIADLLSYHDAIGESKGKKSLVFLKHFLMWGHVRSQEIGLTKAHLTRYTG